MQTLQNAGIAETSFASRFRDTRTAARIVPNKASQHSASISNVAYWRLKKTKLMPHQPTPAHIPENQLWESIAEHQPIPETSFESPLQNQLCGPIPKHQNSSKDRAQQDLPARRPESLTLRTDALKKQSLCPTSPHQPTPAHIPENQLWESIAEPALRAGCDTSPHTRKPALRVHCRTPAHTRNQLWESIAEPALRAGSETPEQQQGSCPTRPPSTAPRISNVAYWRLKKTKLMPHQPTPAHIPENQLWESIAEPALRAGCDTSPHTRKPALRVHCRTPAHTRNQLWESIAEPALRAGSETPEQQQGSCPTRPPSTAPRISNVAYWRLKKTKLMPHQPTPAHIPENQLWESIAEPALRAGCDTSPHTRKPALRVHCRTPAHTRNQLWESIAEPALRAGSETPEQQQGSCPTRPPSTAPRISNVAYWRLKKTKLMPHQPTYQKTSFESPLQNTSPYQKPALRVHCRTSSAGRFRNTRTAARIVPNKTSQHGAPNL